ncbi:MAG: protein-L-isoaspartate(D-aspartate) O-methyltransferase [Chloroflexi bacterium]|jgi:protein-L-isoaspartate(D-aspartate) O-methyltransferase|nr:protein-L-isoaspartate(D-aspartate) O-methyltransferase [Chloroflexota bacterium]
MHNEDDYAQQRAAMVRDQIERRGITDTRLLEVLRTLPRHLFVPAAQQQWAYSDGALRIEAGQTISQPYIVALMTEALGLQGHERVLEVGTGSGYQAAVLAQLCAQVYSIERHAALSAAAGAIFADLEIENIHLHVGDGTLGLPDQAPFDAIMVTAAAPETPPALLDQLADGGRMVIPAGSRYQQVLELWQRRGDKRKSHRISAVAFVPLIGEQGWEK